MANYELPDYAKPENAETVQRNESAVKNLRRARKNYRQEQSADNKSALRQAVHEFIQAHDAHVKMIRA